MKILKIESNLGYYSLDGTEYISIEKIDKEGLLKLVDVVLESDSDIDIDEYNEDLIKDKAHQIIYKSISEKMKQLYQKKDDFKDESDRMFLKEYEKYNKPAQ